MYKKLILEQNIERKKKALKGYKQHPDLFDDEFIKNREKELEELNKKYENQI